MKLELTTLAQHPELIPTVARWYADEWPGFFDDRDAVAYVAEHATDAIPLALLVLADGEPAAVVLLQAESLGPRPDLSPWVAGLYVRPDLRGKDLGQLLVVSASRVAWSLGFERVYAETNATKVFTEVGFERMQGVSEAETSQTLLTLARPEDPPSLYDEIGGEDVVRSLVDRFYDLMDELDEAAEVRAMHARSLKSSREKLFEFLSGWLGGPQLYIEKRGHPRLRARHLPFSIGTNARDQWLMCMNRALDEVIEHEGVRAQIADSFDRMADHMRNREGP